MFDLLDDLLPCLVMNDINGQNYKETGYLLELRILNLFF